MAEKSNQKIQRIDSKASIGFPDINPNPLPNVFGKQKDMKSEPKEREELAADIFQLLVYCERHQNICVSNVISKGLWIPFVSFGAKDSWTQTANKLKEMIGLKSNTLKTSEGLINIFRIQLTQTSNFVERLTYLVRILKETTEESKCCQNSEKYQWISVTEVTEKGMTLFWGPEVHLWVRFWINDEDIKEVRQRNEFDSKDALTDYCDKPSVCQRLEQHLIRSACFAEKDILKIYDIFLQHCFPSQFLNFTSFKVFVKKINLKLNENVLIPTFRAFDCYQRSYITFNELLLGLAAMDQATEHGSEPGVLRCAYLLRYYDSDSDGFLSVDDISRMVTDIQRIPNSVYKNIYKSDKPTEQYATEIIRTHGSDNRISLKQLTEAIGGLKFRGTSALFRAIGPTIKHSMKTSAESKDSLSTVSLIRHNNYENRCETCLQRKYRLSDCVFTMKKSGEVLTFIDIKVNYPPKWIVDSFNQFKDRETYNLSLDLINRLHRIKKVRFESDSKSREDRTSLNNWFYASKDILLKNLMTLCLKTKELMEKEERVLRISTPCYIFGDIHGNLKDLMTFGKVFGRMAPLISEANYLFLGDFVDRGQYGVEVVTYLFALKLIAPKIFWLCRGNHEVRALQEQFTFQNECIDKYNESLWEAINEVFDRLPFAAIVDNKLFCSHGGIPKSADTIEKLNAMPRVLSDPQTEAPVWEILWNDPMGAEDFRNQSLFDRKQAEADKGFLLNTKRGTGFYYSEQAVNRFLERNDFQFIIRGHECVLPGYKFMMNGKVVTIFSSSNYCGLNNEASVLFVNQNKIRVLKVNTFN